jgi:AraC-like DNA-binding protein
VVTQSTAYASADLARLLLKYASDLGLDLEGVGGRGARVPLKRFNVLWQDVAARSGDPDFGLHLAEASADLERAIFLANPQLLERLERFAGESLQALTPPERWSERVTAPAGRRRPRAGHQPPPPAEQAAGGGDHLPRPPRRSPAGDRPALPPAARGPLVEVAFLLGYAEQSAFTHAFKRWTGVSPRHYRDAALAGGPDQNAWRGE